MTNTTTRASREMRGSNHVGMRQFNERTVLRAIRHHGAIPKADLARLTQLTSQTVATIVKRLLADNLLLEQDRIRGKLGQPSVPLALNSDGAFSIGIQIGRRNLEIVVSDFTGVIRHQWHHHYEYPKPTDVLSKIEKGLTQIHEVLGIFSDRIIGIGLSAPLQLHRWGDVLGEPAASAMAQWENLNLIEEIDRITDLPIEFAKDTTAACIAELVQGHGQQIRNFLYIFVGTFIGGGLVMDGHVINGPRGNAGAVGSMLVKTNSKTSSQLLEQASGWQIERDLIEAKKDPLLIQDDVIMGEEYAQWVTPWINQSAQSIAMSVVSAGALLDLDAVVIDGSISPALLTALKEQTSKSLDQLRTDGIHKPNLLQGKVGSHARAIGASLLPLHSQFFPDKDIFLKQI
jgi:predicted NBD/HSP70 family sugar kinase